MRIKTIEITAYKSFLSTGKIKKAGKISELNSAETTQQMNLYGNNYENWKK